MILKLAKLLGVARKDIYCIGDHNNDIPMLEVSRSASRPKTPSRGQGMGCTHRLPLQDGALADVVEILNHRY